MTERVSVNSKVMELNEQESNDIYMTMHLRILSTEVNLNNAIFTSDFIDGVVDNKQKYIGTPFLVNREALENDEYLTHELNLDTGELGTDQIGSFTDFWKETEEDTEVLMGNVRIYKRFKATCDKIVEQVSNNSLSTSCEVLVNAYKEISEDGVRSIHYNDGKNAFIGSAIVTDAAMPSAKPTLLIAEAYKKDIELEQKGGEKLPNNKEYNNGIKVEYVGDLETSSLKFYEVEQQIFNSINPVDVKTGYREYNYYIHTLYHDKVIVESESNYGLFSADYKVENDTVILSPQSEWKKGSFQFVPEGVTVAELMDNNTDKIKELQSELDELKEEKANMSKEQKLTVEELSEKIEQLETEISELKEKNEGLEATIVSQKEEAVKAEETLKELNATIEELTPYKEKVEKAELEAKQEELSNKFEKVLSEETFATEEVAEAIKNLDEAKLNSIVVAEVAKNSVETASKDVDTVEVSATRQGDLVEAAKDANYWASKK